MDERPQPEWKPVLVRTPDGFIQIDLVPPTPGMTGEMAERRTRLRRWRYTPKLHSAPMHDHWAM